jgi:hypothetical protein
MKKCLIYTLYGNYNYGNKLQNFAVQKLFENRNFMCYTKVYKPMNENVIRRTAKRILKSFIPKYKNDLIKEKARLMNFLKFDSLINKISSNKININDYDIVIVGSDQVWNPNDKMSRAIVSDVNRIKDKKIISLSASIASENIEDKYINRYKYQFNLINKISVREESGQKMIEKLTGRTDVKILLDPTMLIDITDWNKILIKPEMIDKLCPNGERFILNYFLGSISKERIDEIQLISQNYNCKIINILDKNDPFYTCGPSEFIWLEKNAFLICTDSFHSSVFAILYKVPFIVFNRNDGQNGKNNMNSRLENLLSKFELESRYCTGQITKELVQCDYSKIDDILNKEKEKANTFLNDSI